MQALRHVSTKLPQDDSVAPGSWRMVLEATVEMRLEACRRWVAASLAGNATDVQAATVLHADAARIAFAYRLK